MIPETVFDGSFGGFKNSDLVVFALKSTSILRKWVLNKSCIVFGLKLHPFSMGNVKGFRSILGQEGLPESNLAIGDVVFIFGFIIDLFWNNVLATITPIITLKDLSFVNGLYLLLLWVDNNSRKSRENIFDAFEVKLFLFIKAIKRRIIIKPFLDKNRNVSKLFTVFRLHCNIFQLKVASIMASDSQSVKVNFIFYFSERVLTLWSIFQFRNTQFERLEYTLAISLVFISWFHKLNTFVLLKFFKVRFFKENSGKL